MPDALRNAAAPAFARAKPFPHVVLDGFLPEEHARALLAQFPAYDEARFVGPGGRPAKACFEDVRALGPAFRALDDLARSAAFLRALSRLTGIPGLLYDPSYHGGGAQENREGMRLWPHIDFNHDLKSGWRRLNLLLYLNDGWRRGDGGRLQLHASPRSRPALSVEPVFNRCVIFETSQRSWHSVEPVAEGRSRRSVSLYFYTAEAPLPLVPPHRTVWEYPPLPRQARAGAVLDEPLLAAIRRVLTLRDEELAAFGAPSPAEPLPRDWAAGRSLSAEDASWLRAELSRRDEALQRCWRPFKN